MFRSSLIMAGAALLCSTALAQTSVDATKRLPITAPIRDAGTVDITTGKWTNAGASTKAITTVYNNTCTWSGGNFYSGVESCEDLYDEGQVPSSTNTDWQTASTGLGGSGSGAADSQPMDAFQFAYCIYNATAGIPTGVDLEFAFWDNLNGDCVGGVPPTPPHWSKVINPGGGGLGTQTAYFDLAGLGLPGSTADGFQACWIVTIDVSNTGWTMQSDGEGIFDNDGALDKFAWGFRFNTVTPVATSANGWILSGDPGYAPYGTCTYDIPCATDVFGGAACGTGYGQGDTFWINVDGGLPGVQCPAGASAGSTCYWFGGYPTSLLSGFYMTLDADVGPAGAAQFCTSKPSSLPGCTPTLSGPAGPLTKGGAPGAVAVAAPAVGGGNPGILIYSVTGQTANPINTQFGFLCIQSFFRGSAFAKVPGGTLGNCDGVYNFDLQGLVNTAPAINAGSSVWLQEWYRDPGQAPAFANFTNGVGPIAVQ